MNKNALQYLRSQMAKENRKFTEKFIKAQVKGGAHPSKGFLEAYRNNKFLVQVFLENGITRISINRTMLEDDGIHWKQGITWDEIQNIKNEIGFADKCFVELYPAEKDVVDVANIRHIFIMDPAPVFMWRKDDTSASS